MYMIKTKEVIGLSMRSMNYKEIKSNREIYNKYL